MASSATRFKLVTNRQRSNSTKLRPSSENSADNVTNSTVSVNRRNREESRPAVRLLIRPQAVIVQERDSDDGQVQPRCGYAPP